MLVLENPLHATLLLSCHLARSHSSGLSFMGYRGGAHLGYDDEWRVPQPGMSGIDFGKPLVTFEEVVHGRAPCTGP